MLTIAILIYQPAWFWYVTMHFPRDVARAVAYCLVAIKAARLSVYAMRGTGEVRGRGAARSQSGEDVP